MVLGEKMVVMGAGFDGMVWGGGSVGNGTGR